MADLSVSRRGLLKGTAASMVLVGLPLIPYEVQARKRVTRHVAASFKRTTKLLPLLLPNPLQRKAARRLLRKGRPFKVHGLDRVQYPAGVRQTHSERHVNVALERCGEIQALYLKYAKRLPTQYELGTNLAWLCNTTTKRVALSPLVASTAFAQDVPAATEGTEAPADSGGVIGALGTAAAIAISVEGMAVSLEGGAALVSAGGALIAEGLAAETITATAALTATGSMVTLTGLGVIAMGLIALYLYWDYVLPEIFAILNPRPADDPLPEPTTPEPTPEPTPEQTPTLQMNLEITVAPDPTLDPTETNNPPDDAPEGPEGEGEDAGEGDGDGDGGADGGSDGGGGDGGGGDGGGGDGGE